MVDDRRLYLRRSYTEHLLLSIPEKPVRPEHYFAMPSVSTVIDRSLLHG